MHPLLAFGSLYYMPWIHPLTRFVSRDEPYVHPARLARLSGAPWGSSPYHPSPPRVPLRHGGGVPFTTITAAFHYPVAPQWRPGGGNGGNSIEGLDFYRNRAIIERAEGEQGMYPGPLELS